MPDDYAGNITTSTTLSIGATRFGEIETIGDHDWFIVNLVAGRSYEFRANSSGLGDPILSLRNASGSQLAYNDDNGTSSNSMIAYTAITTGIYYLDVAGYLNNTGSYSLSATFLADTIAPTVSSYSPGDGVNGVAVSSNLVLTFSEAIQRGSGTISLRSGSATGTVVENFDAATSSKLSISGSVLTIDPTANLLNGTHYYLTFGSGSVKDLANNSYAGTSAYDFTTITDTIAPTVSSYSPGDGVTGVSVSSNLVLTFSEAIQRGSGTISLRSGSATGTVVENFDAAISSKLSISGSVLTIDPTANLLNGTHYYLTFSSGSVKDLANNSYAGTSAYDFTTITDTIAPTVSSYSPGDGVTGVAVSSNLVLTFSEAIQRGSGTISLRSGSATGTVVENFDAATSSKLSISGSVLTIDPTANLLNGTHYYLTFGSGSVKDFANNSYAGTSAYDFTTITDTIAPTVSSYSPGDGVNGVAVSSNLVLTFSEAIQRGSGTIYLRSGSATGTVIESFDAATNCKLRISGSFLTIDPTANLLNSTHYYLTFSSGSVKDFADNSYAGTSAYDFTTIADTITPTVFSGVSVDNNLVLTFSEAIQRGSGTISLRSGSATGTVVENFDAAISSKLSISGSVLTIDPTANLSVDTHYYLTLGSGSVKDLANNSYAGTSAYDFTTWSTVSGYGLIDVDAMIEKAIGKEISDAALFGDKSGEKDWAVNAIKAPNAWGAGYTGKDVIVAVIDTGVDYEHPDLKGNIWVNTDEIRDNGIDDDKNGYVDDIYGYDFVHNDSDPLDDNGHGTHVAGIIASLKNADGSTGIAYEAKIMPVKVAGADRSINYEDVSLGIKYAVNNGANVINLSLGRTTLSRYETSAIIYAIDHGVIVCMSSGNDAALEPVFPALFARTKGGIAVGAVDKNNALYFIPPKGSNNAGAGPYDFVVAPGVDVYSTVPEKGYTTGTGTSMAAPMVAGAAALLLSAKNDFSSPWTLEQLENLITMTSRPLSSITPITSVSATDASVVAASSIDILYGHLEQSITSLASLDTFFNNDNQTEVAELVGISHIDALGMEMMVI